MWFLIGWLDTGVTGLIGFLCQSPRSAVKKTVKDYSSRSVSTHDVIVLVQQMAMLISRSPNMALASTSHPPKKSACTPAGLPFSVGSVCYEASNWRNLSRFPLLWTPPPTPWRAFWGRRGMRVSKVWPQSHLTACCTALLFESSTEEPCIGWGSLLVFRIQTWCRQSTSLLAPLQQACASHSSVRIIQVCGSGALPWHLGSSQPIR